MSKSTLAAVLCADLHLTLQAPACRADKDWLEVQAGYLRQLRKLADRGQSAPAPILCAGDIFDRWNAPAELINFALKHLPDGMICVPGQHDLPNHRMDLMHRSGYGVLVEAKKIVDLSNVLIHSIGPIVVHGFGWEQEVEPIPNKNDQFTIALIHQYVWVAGAKYPGAPEHARVGSLKTQLKGYDLAVFGDNHKPFDAVIGNCRVFNCGGFMRRKSDEIEHRPRVGLLYEDGTVKTHYLDVAKDCFHLGVKEREEIPVDMKQFIESLEDLGEQSLDFREAVRHHLRTADLKKSTRALIEEIMDKV